MYFINELEYINEAGDDFFNRYLNVREYAKILDIAQEKQLYDIMLQERRTTVESHDHALDQLGGYCWLIRNHLY